MAARPIRVSVRMYQVGFGDCFLVSFAYARPLADGRRDRHVLIDFGSTRHPEDFRVDFAAVATDIQTRTGGTLDVVVVTHRHKDHLSAFGMNQVAARLSELAPRLVVRPWTEDPALPADAPGPVTSPRFRAGLSAGQAFAQTLAGTLAAARAGTDGAELRALAEDQVANQDAIDQLDAWANESEAAYVHADGDPGMRAHLPGVTVTVLGPPTIEQCADIAQQRADDPEYWMLHQQLLAPPLAAGLAPDDPDIAGTIAAIEANIAPGPLRWLAEHLRDQQVHSLTRLVRILDDAMNNTSIILLFEIGTTGLLFPGDAQIENWNYTLDRLAKNKRLRERLAGIDLYKVGHHGSRNATPRSLYKLWDDTPTLRPRTALMSTRSGIHGRSAATKVPRATLVTALERTFTLYSTETLTAAAPSLAVTAEIGTSTGFEPAD